MARDRDRGDSTSPSIGQSKRPSNAHDSDSLDNNDIVQHQHAQHQHPQLQHRKSHQKHHVGGAGTRLHARVPSSKGLYKNNVTTSSTKLNRRLTSPSPERSTPSSHRRNPSSEVKLSREPSGTNLKKNASSSSLKRNRSHVEVAKRNKSASQLKRSSSEKAVSKTKAAKSAVHFDLGNDGQDDGDDGDDWVDASSSASPYLSRRGSVNNSGQSSGRGSASPSNHARGSVQTSGDDEDGDEEATPLADPQRGMFDERSQHSRNLTSRLLQRTPSHSATTSMSTTLAMARAASPDSRHSASTLSVTPAQPQGIAGSDGKDEITSRFITQTSGASYFTSGDGSRSVSASQRPQSASGLSERADTGLSTATTQVKDEDEITDEEDTGITSAIATTARRRKEGTPVTAPPEKSRTQQKINLQRASSSMEPVRHRHSGIGGFAAEVAEVAGPLLGGAGYESQDPRVNKLLERTGVEYNIVRRYQNPVARSLSRLAQLPGNDKARRIPKGSASRHSVANFGLSQSFRDTNGTRRPETPKRAFSAVRHNGAGSSLDTDDGGVAARMHEGQSSRLSGASLVNGEDDDGIQSILRSMWDKNLGDLAASEE